MKLARHCEFHSDKLEISKKEVENSYKNTEYRSNFFNITEISKMIFCKERQ